MEENAQQPSQRKGMPMGVIVVVLIIILAVAGFVYSSTNKTQNATKEQSTAEQTNAKASPTSGQIVKKSAYKDGTYKATGEYMSPGGQESLEVSLTLKDGVITDSNVVSQAQRPISKEKQGEFISGYKSQVIGKNIDEVNVGKVSGSSLSPKGFNDAVSKIKQQAQA